MNCLAKNHSSNSISIVQKRFFIALCLLLGAVGLWLTKRNDTPTNQDKSTANVQAGKSHDRYAEAQESNKQLTKSSLRQELENTHYHSPERLKQFMMPDVYIDGLTLEAALQKLMRAYEDACKLSRQKPLRLSFVVSRKDNKKLKLHTGSRDFHASVRLLASLAGMKVTRKELIYQFDPIEHSSKTSDKEFAADPSFLDKLKNIVGAESRLNDQSNLKDYLRAMGIELDPSTQLLLDSTGQLKLTNANAADTAAISALIEAINTSPLQQEIQTRVTNIESEDAWKSYQEILKLPDNEREERMQELIEQKLVTITKPPSVIVRSGDTFTVEMLRGLKVPIGNTPDQFEIHQVGRLLNGQVSPLAFGSTVNINYNHTDGDIDNVTGQPDIETKADITASGFTENANPMLSTQTLPDGTRQILTNTIIQLDANAKPTNP